MPGFGIGNVAIAEQDLAVIELFQPGDQLQQCGLAAARRPDQNDQFAALGDEVEGFQDRTALGIAFGDGAEDELVHGDHFPPVVTWLDVRKRWRRAKTMKAGTMVRMAAAKTSA